MSRFSLANSQTKALTTRTTKMRKKPNFFVYCVYRKVQRLNKNRKSIIIMPLKPFRPESTAFDTDHLNDIIEWTDKASHEIGVVIWVISFDQVCLGVPWSSV